MPTNKKGGAFFPVLFLLISALFISILGFTYYQTRLANPIMLDEKGHVK